MTTQAKQIKVTFQPQGRSVFVLEGANLLEAAGLAGLTIDTPCGGAGTCGKCRVRISQGAPEPGVADQKAFAKAELADGWRLACQTRVRNDLTVNIPSESLFGQEHQIARDSTLNEGMEVRPAIRKIHFKLEPPSLEDPRPDLLRLESATGPFKIDLPMLRHAPRQLRMQKYQGTAVFSDKQLISVEEGDTTGLCFGIAVDIGTTTMVATLLNLWDGRELAVESRVNPQVSFGDDVLSRILHASSCPHCLDELRRSVSTEIGSMIQTLCADAEIAADFIYEIAVAGNTTMQHLLCGVDPSPLGAVPFAPAYGRGMLLPARELEIPINPRGMCYVFPVIGGFVGGDTVAGMLASRFDELEQPALMVDIGTNGEIMLAYDGELIAASTAAGPAFEGAKISCGMRGTRGAIEKVVIDDDVRVGVIGNVAPMGVCGSGLIDLVAELLQVGVVSPEGQLLPPEELPVELPAAVRRRIRLDDNGRTEFVIVEANGGGHGRELTLTQRDIRELQVGTGAIRAGISMLLRHANIAVDDLKTVLVAGGFGGFIRRDKAQRLGLLPSGLDHNRIHYVGNVSLAGARKALLSVLAREHAESIARKTQHIELSMDGDFQMEFAEAMIFPES